VLDDFNSGTMLSSSLWLGDSNVSQYTVSGGVLQSIDHQTTNSVYWHQTQGATQEVSAKFVSWDAHLWAMQLFLKSVEADQYAFSIMISYSNDFYGPNWLAISYPGDGNWVNVAQLYSPPVSAGDVIGARSSPNGCVELFVNGTLILNGDLSTSRSMSGTLLDPALYDGTHASYVGLGQEGSSNDITAPAVFDDFGATSY